MDSEEYNEIKRRYIEYNNSKNAISMMYQFGELWYFFSKMFLKDIWIIFKFNMFKLFKRKDWKEYEKVKGIK